ncbi:MAG TPA: hypothetical protein VJU60_05390 [Thermoleophilaceae bacterium]|nr:hypothetical protein [Thermoleophilaceae bacterium]
MLAAAPAEAVTFTNAAPVAIPAGAPTAGSGPAGPYPSDIGVAGVTGPVVRVNAILHGFHHEYTQDVRVLLVGPGGQSSVLMANVGTQRVDSPAPVELSFDDAGLAVPCYVNDDIPLAGGVYAPTFYPTGDSTGHCDSSLDTTPFEAPAPSGPYAAGLAVFNGLNPNGVWHLYVDDDSNPDTGAIDGGWSLRLTITPPTVTAPQMKGAPEVGKTLTGVSGAITSGGGAFWQWQRCSARGTGCTPIQGATGPSYKAVRADRGHTLMLAETALNSGGTAGASSPPSAIVGPALLSTSGTHRSQKARKQKGLVVKVRSNLAGSLTASAKAGKLHFRGVKRKLRAGRRSTLRLRLPRHASIPRGARAKLTLTLKDTHGGRAVKRMTIRLR